MGEDACAAGAAAKAMAASAPQARGRRAREGCMLEFSKGFVMDRALVAPDRPGFQHGNVTSHTGKRRSRKSLSSSSIVRGPPMENRVVKGRKRAPRRHARYR